MKTLRNQLPTGRRSGVTLVLVLVCLVLVTAYMSAMLRKLQVARQHDRLVERRAQARLLAESGIERAVAILQSQPDYRGEVWEVAGAEWGQAEGQARREGMVTIEVDAAEGPRQIFVEAMYPKHATVQAKVTKRVTIGD